MDQLSSYRELIKRILTQYVELDQRQPTPGVESLLIADDERGHYQLFSLGWAGRQRVRNCRVYVRLKDGKSHIEHDLTEHGIATDLLAAGVSNEDSCWLFTRRSCGRIPNSPPPEWVLLKQSTAKE